MVEMLIGNLTRFVDKQAPLILCRLSHQSHLLINKSHTIKHRCPLLIFQNNFTNILNTILEKQVDWGPFADIRQFLKENVSGNHIAISTFMDIFHINRSSAKSILCQHRVFTEIPKNIIIYNYQLLNNSGLHTHLIQSNVSLLAEDSSVLKRKIEIVKYFSDDINSCIPFFHHSVSELNLFVKSRKVKNKDNSLKDVIDYYQEELMIERKNVYHIVSKNLYYVIHHPKETIKKIKLLLDCKVTANQLINSDWPMFCNYQHMKNRLTQCSVLGMLEPIQPYILICPEIVFVRKLKNNVKKKSLNNQHSQIVEYLSNKSRYSEKIIKYKISHSLAQHQLPTLLTLQRRVKIILNEGYDYHDIVWYIKVISLSEDLITNRFLSIKAINHKAPFLNVLLLSDKHFIEYLNKQNNSKNKI